VWFLYNDVSWVVPTTLYQRDFGRPVSRGKNVEQCIDGYRSEPGAKFPFRFRCDEIVLALIPESETPRQGN